MHTAATGVLCSLGGALGSLLKGLQGVLQPLETSPPQQAAPSGPEGGAAPQDPTEEHCARAEPERADATSRARRPAGREGGAEPGARPISCHPEVRAGAGAGAPEPACPTQLRASLPADLCDVRGCDVRCARPFWARPASPRARWGSCAFHPGSRGPVVAEVAAKARRAGCRRRVERAPSRPERLVLPVGMGLAAVASFRVRRSGSESAVRGRSRFPRGRDRRSPQRA